MRGWCLILLVFTGATIAAEAPSVFMQAHRGGLDEVPENTMPAFEHAWGIPGAIPEMDLQTTQDGVIVLMHDDTPARTTDAPAPYATMKLAEIPFAETQRWDAAAKFGAQDLRAKYAGTRIPTLAQVFDVLRAHPQREVYLDLKAVDLTQLKREIDAAGVGKQVLFVHGDIAMCARLKELFPGARTMTWLSGPPSKIQAKYAALTDAQLAGVSQLQFHLPVQSAGPPIQYALPDDFLKQAHARLKGLGVELQLRPMKFDHESLTRLVALGVRWFVADAPAAFHHALTQPAP